MFPSPAALQHVRERLRHPLVGSDVPYPIPLFVPDTFSYKMRKWEGEDTGRGMDALSKTGSFTSEDKGFLLQSMSSG